MRRPRVKICGLTRAADADLAVALGADAIGFVLWPGSPRAIPAADAASIAHALPPFVTRVGVFVNPSPEEVANAVRQIGLDVAQLHGDESVAQFRHAAPRLIKGVTLQTPADVQSALDLPPDVTVLVDAADDERRGGTGRQADWRRAAEIAHARRTILAGGLNAGNIARALDQVQPWAVDVSSGVEDAPGRKSDTRLRALFQAIENWELGIQFLIPNS